MNFLKLKKLNKLDIFKNEKLLSLEKLKKQGFCNINYKLNSCTNSYLLRVFKDDSTVNISREYEYKIQKKAWEKSIAPKPLYLNKKKSFMITEFLEGIHKYKLKKIEVRSIIKNIKKLHKIKSSEKSYDIKNDFKNYKKLLQDKDSKKIIKESLKELKKIDKYKKRPVSTHHDLNPRNIIFYKNSVKFIDWEYAGVNDCFFDLATICVEFKLNKKMQNLALEYYFKKSKEKNKKAHKKSLNSYMKIYKNLCILWFKTLK
ncbi:MAG: choline/ethanolamine kinase family protein [Halarcobacter sp.]